MSPRAYRALAGIFIWGLLCNGGAAHAAQKYLQCLKSELVQANCTSTSTNTTPLHFTASCQVCSGGGSDISCEPGEVATAAALSVEVSPTNTPVAGSMSKTGDCGMGNQLFTFDGALTQGTTYNVLLTVQDLGKKIILTFTAGASSPGSDIGIPPLDAFTSSKDSGGGSGSDSGSTATGDGASSSSDGSGTNPGSTDDEGCGCVVARDAPAGPPLIGLLLLLWLVRRRTR